LGEVGGEGAEKRVVTEAGKSSPEIRLSVSRLAWVVRQRLRDRGDRALDRSQSEASNSSMKARTSSSSLGRWLFK
jgi:hypothetical protein